MTYVTDWPTGWWLLFLYTGVALFLWAYWLVQRAVETERRGRRERP